MKLDIDNEMETVRPRTDDEVKARLLRQKKTSFGHILRDTIDDVWTMDDPTPEEVVNLVRERLEMFVSIHDQVGDK